MSRWTNEKGGRRRVCLAGLVPPLLLDVRQGLGVALQGQRRVPRLVEILGESWRDLRIARKPAQLLGFSFSVGCCYYGRRVLLLQGGGSVTTGPSVCSDSHLPGVLSHCPPTAASWLTRLRAVCRRFLMAFTLVTSSHNVAAQRAPVPPVPDFAGVYPTA